MREPKQRIIVAECVAAMQEMETGSVDAVEVRDFLLKLPELVEVEHVLRGAATKEEPALPVRPALAHTEEDVLQKRHA